MNPLLDILVMRSPVWSSLQYAIIFTDLLICSGILSGVSGLVHPYGLLDQSSFGINHHLCELPMDLKSILNYIWSLKTQKYDTMFLDDPVYVFPKMRPWLMPHKRYRFYLIRQSTTVYRSNIGNMKFLLYPERETFPTLVFIRLGMGLLIYLET